MTSSGKPSEPSIPDSDVSDLDQGPKNLPAEAGDATRADMHPSDRLRLESRVARAAEEALAQKQFVSAIDVLLGLGWLRASHLESWRLGRTACLERVVQANLHRLTHAMAIFRRWAKARGLLPRENVYVSHTRGRHVLRFSVSGKPSIEQGYRTHWISPQLSERKRERLAEIESAPPEGAVVSPLHAWTCVRCGGTGALLFMQDDQSMCLRCAGLDHLVFLPAGDAELSRRAELASSLSADVVRFSRKRKRYVRQGLLVEEAALEAAKDAGWEDGAGTA